MLPEILDLGFARINSYGLLIGLGTVLSFIVLERESRRRQLKSLSANLLPIFLMLALAVFVGGKVFYMLLHPETHEQNVNELGLAGALGRGFVFYGSVLTALPVLFWRFRAHGIPIRKGFDVMIFCGPIVHGFGRLGCFCAGCCHGCVTDGSLGVTFHEGMGIIGVPVHAVQLYEACGELLIFLFLWFGPRLHARFDGQTALSYLALYAVLRFITEFFRGDGNPVLFAPEGHVHVAGDAPAGLTAAQITSILIIIPAVTLLVRGFRRHGLLNA